MVNQGDSGCDSGQLPAYNLVTFPPLGRSCALATEGMSSFFDATNGSGLIGSWLSASMYGVTLAQTYIFFNRPLRSSTFLRMLVLCLWLLDTIHTAVVCTTVYHYSVTNAFNEAAILDTTWSITASVGINVIVVTICQSAPSKTFAEYSTKQSVGFLPYAITQLPVDFAIAGSLCVLLYKKRTGFQRTETIINTLILYAVNRCVFTSVVALVEALAVGIAPDSFWFSAAEFVIGQREFPFGWLLRISI
ncbi:hypothetical protein BDP27DRAFT_1432864 [Rhodocollybia butyracea]|uniref:DUF6534 domain-containing protein n=1 Tax=Rhodocollybia butyracea TaxID=206335 RepID=A0A9P5P7R0_9AGAR|nr:hypothetical protein BDP27DRAFT_1432864 [Rhodocollybia butyracea]